MNVGLDVVLNIRHLNLIVHNISRKVPKLRNFFLSLEQFMELPQRQLSEIVVIQL
jgi:hypothetical protein